MKIRYFNQNFSLEKKLAKQSNCNLIIHSNLSKLKKIDIDINQELFKEKSVYYASL